MKDYYVEMYQERFNGLYDRENPEFRRDLQELIRIAYSCAARSERERILNKVKNTNLTFAVDRTVKDFEQVVNVRVSKCIEEII